MSTTNPGGTHLFLLLEKKKDIRRWVPRPPGWTLCTSFVVLQC